MLHNVSRQICTAVGVAGWEFSAVSFAVVDFKRKARNQDVGDGKNQNRNEKRVSQGVGLELCLISRDSTKSRRI